MRPLDNWVKLGFGTCPDRKVSPRSGLLLYRAWGASSSELGSGFFSLEKPASVLDAELRFNIADWGNGVHFVSSFRLKYGFDYFEGPVAHGKFDLSRTGTQVYVTPPIDTKIERIGAYEVLRHDVSVVQRPGRA